jgi:uncharacterized protein (TIGR02646 family)
MYQLPVVNLAGPDMTALANQQATVNAQSGFPAQVAKAKANFATKPRALFERVRDGLKTMSGDLVRCAYCEDSCADEVEHVRPKDFYPGRVFDWMNYVFSCGPCNGGKNNNYSVIDPDQVVIDLRTHRIQNGIIPPPAGLEALIDPRVENPLVYLWLDLSGDFRFAVFDEVDPTRSRRAEFTLRVLKLNRDMLLAARRNAFGGYRDRLAQYVARKAVNAPLAELQQRTADLMITPHRTVWLEMKRQRNLLGPIAELFQQAPEALAW